MNMSNTLPWYRRAHRWMQCNLSELDPRDCDIEQWRQYWRGNQIQGTIINAAGTIGYYPTSNPYQYLAKSLDGKDFFKVFSDAAREEGLVIIARMDSNQATGELLRDKPEWFSRDIDGNPIKAADNRYFTCVNTGYYTQQLAGMIREIIQRYHPDGMADNSWAGQGGLICYCDTCRRKFRADTGMELPVKVDFSDHAYRVWLDWNRRRRTELYHWFNSLSKQYGGEDCVYLAMLHPDAYNKSAVDMAMDYTEYAADGKAVMIDGQIRMSATGFDANTLQGLSMHEIFGDDALVIESVATYHMVPSFMRKAANVKGETDSWMRAGMIAGISPSCHFIGGVQEDRRAFRNGADMYRWHISNEQYLYDRHPVANVALIRNFKNTYYYGMDQCQSRTIAPMEGMISALKRGRIPFRPLDIRQLKGAGSSLKAIILPDIAVMTDEQLDDVIQFVKGGGSIVYSGATGMLDAWGYPRKHFPLDELFGLERQERAPIEASPSVNPIYAGVANYAHHTYLRIHAPEHPIFRGFEDTQIIEFGGDLYHVSSSRLKSLATLVPPFPVYPPETAFIPDGKHDSDDGCIFAGDTGYGGRVVYLAADIDRRSGLTCSVDQGNLLKNAIRWVLNGQEPFTVEGPGELSCVLYRQEAQRRFVLQLLNHSGLGKWPGSVEEYYTVGPEAVALRSSVPARRIELRNLGIEVPSVFDGNTIRFEIPSIYDQELVVIEE